jgi:hypothetical protein
VQPLAVAVEGVFESADVVVVALRGDQQPPGRVGQARQQPLRNDGAARVGGVEPLEVLAVPNPLGQPLQVGHDTSPAHAAGGAALVGALAAQEEREPADGVADVLDGDGARAGCGQRPHLLLRQVHQPGCLHVAEMDGAPKARVNRGQPDRGAPPGRGRAIGRVAQGLPPQPQVGRGGADGGQVRGEQVGGLVLAQPHHGGLHLAGADPAAGAQLRLVADQDLQPHQRLDTGQGNLVDGGVDRVGLRRPGVQVRSTGIGPLPLVGAAQPGAPQRRHPQADRHSAGAEPRSRRGLGGQVGSRGQAALSRLAGARLAQAGGLSRPDAAHRAGPLAVDAPLGRRGRGGAPCLDIARAAGRLPRRAATLAQPRLARRRPLAARVRAVPQDVPRFPRREAQAVSRRV